MVVDRWEFDDPFQQAVFVTFCKSAPGSASPALAPGTPRKLTAERTNLKANVSFSQAPVSCQPALKPIQAETRLPAHRYPLHSFQRFSSNFRR